MACGLWNLLCTHKVCNLFVGVLWRVSEFSGMEWWTGIVEWTGMVEWAGLVEWNGNKLDTSDWFSPLYRPPLNKDHPN